MNISTKHGVTWRSVLLGFLIVPLMAGFNMSVETIRYAGQPSTIAVFPHVVFVLLLLLAANGLIGLRRPQWRLSPAELLVVYFMAFMGANLASHDLVEVLVPVLSYPFKYANPANKWATEVLPYLPKWLMVSDPMAVDRYWLGNSNLLRSGDLWIWMKPALIWTAFLGTLSYGLFCLNVLLRRQWVEREKLAYPLVTFVVELVQPKQPLFRNKAFWVAFIIVALIDFWFGLAKLFPSIPEPFVRYQVLQTGAFPPPWNSLPWLPLAFYPFLVGIGVLLPTDLLFSCWFFFWVWALQPVIAAYYGWNQIPGFPYVPFQAMGGFMAIAVMTVYTARKALGRGFRAIWHGADGEDAGEAMSYRWAALGFIGAMLAIGVFLTVCGMSWWTIAATLLIYTAIALSMTRMRAELGAPAHDPGGDVGPQNLIPLFAGVENMRRPDVAMFGLISGFNRGYRGHPMPPHAEGLQAANKSGIAQRAMFWVLLLAAVWGLLSGFLINVHLNYAWGAAANVDPPYVSTIFGREPFDRISSQLQAAASSTQRTNSMIAVGVGFLVTMALSITRLNMVNFPLHPVGYAISFNWSMSLMWLTLLTAWLCKTVIIRTGGLRLYRNTLPFFLGVTLGECFMGSIWYLVSVFTGTKTFILWPYG